MSPRPQTIKDQPSKLKKLQRSKDKKRTPGRLAPSRTYTACVCPPRTQYATWRYSTIKKHCTWHFPPANKPCECSQYTPTLPPKKPDPVRRNFGRMDGVRWKGSSFICASSIDARTTYDIIDDCDIGEWDVDWMLEGQEEKLPDGEISVSLLDIARPAKPKGIAKHFEVVESLRRVIALEDVADEDFEQEEDEDWEDLYGEEWDLSLKKQRRAYSTIVRENCC